MIKNSIVLILLLMTLHSCHPLYCDWDRGYEPLTTIENKQRVAGTYSLSKKFEDYIKSKGYSEVPSLQLHESGAFTLMDMPEFVLDPNEKDPNGTVTDTSGTWKVSCDEPYGCLIELENVAVVSLSHSKKGVMSIPITIGDGDMCKGIVFEKEVFSQTSGFLH